MKKGTFIRTQADLDTIIANENFKPIRYCSVGGDVIVFENCYINPNGDIIRISNYIEKYGYEITARLTRADLLAGSVNNAGYVLVGIAGKSFTLHRLVASTFLKDDPNKREIDHLDFNKLNNNVTNLEYVTRKENVRRWRARKGE